MFNVDLVHDAGTGWDDGKVIEGLLSPTEESVSFRVALEFDLDVALEGVSGAEHVDDDGMVDNELSRNLRIHERRIRANRLRSVAHGSEIDNCWHSVGVVQKDPGCKQVD